MTDSIPNELKNDINRQVLDHLAGKSAHSDLADALTTALKPLGDVQVFCPDWRQYRYVAASTRGVLFAFAIGMSTVGLRLDERMKARALACGAMPFPECGESWVSLTLFRDDWPKVDLEFWARKAYVATREVASRPRMLKRGLGRIAFASNRRPRGSPGSSPAGSRPTAPGS